MLVSSPSGQVIPLGQVADIKRVEGPSEIASENGRLRVFVQANVLGRDLGGFVEDVKARIDREIVPTLPRGMTIEYSGEFENQIRAARTLRLIVPSVLFIIFLLLYIVYHNAKEAAHVILAVPFALSGGVFLQYLLGFNFSVAVWVGYIALFGTAIQTGVVMVVYLEEAVERRKRERGSGLQLRRSHRRGEGRRTPPPATKGDDRRHHRRQSAADHVEHPHRRGSHEAARHARHRRHDQQPPAHPHRHAGDLRLAPCARLAVDRPLISRKTRFARARSWRRASR